MSVKDMFRVNKIIEELNSCKAQLEKATNDYNELNNFLTPELRELHDVQIKIKEVENAHAASIKQHNDQIEHLNEAIKQNDQKISEQNEVLKNIRHDILVAEDIIEMESFSLYKPRYDFATSSEYAERLKSVRDEQKRSIKEDTATHSVTTWTVNGSAAQGRKMVKDTVKLCLRSFNNECDAAVSAVKFNNFDRCRQRIEKSAEAIEKLGKIMSISISEHYITLKIRELRLALEYQQKKQEEKEALKELKAQEREAAKLAKEIEEARKASYKEQKHYANALKTIDAQIANCTNDDDKAELENKKAEILGQLNQIEEELKQIDYREANQKAGYVYIISNIGAFGEGVYKIGMTRRLEPMDRIDELGDASVPFNFDVHAMIFSDDAPALEAALHRAFEDKKVNMVNQRREFFKVSLDEIKKVIKENHDKTVEFIDIPDAEQYRESLKIKNSY